MTVMPMNELTFPSKVDGCLALALIGSAVVCTGAVVALGLIKSPFVALVLSPLLLVSVVLPLWLLRSTSYVLGETTLDVQSGPFKWRVPLNEIQQVSSTRNPLSSPALSLDRIRIDYGPGKAIMISPVDKSRFLAELERRRQGS